MEDKECFRRCLGLILKLAELMEVFRIMSLNAQKCAWQHNRREHVQSKSSYGFKTGQTMDEGGHQKCIFRRFTRAWRQTVPSLGTHAKDI